MSVISKNLYLDSECGKRWAIPVSLIVNNRAEAYGGDEALKETIDIFESDDFEIEDWAKNNMNWSDVKPYATLVKDSSTDMQELWVNGEMSVDKN